MLELVNSALVKDLGLLMGYPLDWDWETGSVWSTVKDSRPAPWPAHSFVATSDNWLESEPESRLVSVDTGPGLQPE